MALFGLGKKVEPAKLPNPPADAGAPQMPIDLGITGETEFGAQVVNMMGLEPSAWSFSPDCSMAVHKDIGMLEIRGDRVLHRPGEFYNNGSSTITGHKQRYLTAEDAAKILVVWKEALTRAVDLPPAVSATATAAKAQHAQPSIQHALQQQLHQQQQYAQQQLQTLQQYASELNAKFYNPMLANGIGTPPMKAQSKSHTLDATRYMLDGVNYPNMSSMLAHAQQLGLTNEDLVNMAIPPR